jgi:hypothetical protein
MHLRGFIFYSTILSIFTEAIRYRYIIDLKGFYIVILINLVIFILLNLIKYNKGLFILHLLLILNGIVSCWWGYNNLNNFFAQFVGLFIIPVYFFTYFSLFKDRFEDIVLIYCKLSVLIAIIGFIQLILDINLSSFALKSVMLEPSHYCTIVLPALFITFKEKSYPRYYYRIIFISIVLSFSSLGFLGIGLAILLSSKNISLIKGLFSFLFILIIGIGLYMSFTPFKIRIDDTINAVQTQNLSGINLSSYSLISNLFVSIKSFSTNPLFGNGIGSHELSRKIYLEKIEGIEGFEQYFRLNSKDANSLLLRIISELGIIGIIGMISFISKFYIPFIDEKNSYYTFVSRGLILYFFCKLLREGHYFSPEMYFFVGLYVYNYKMFIKNV